MEVTGEMIRAVEAHKRGKAREYEQECARRRREWTDRVENEAKQGARNILPGLTDDQFYELADVFSAYFEEMWDR